jgi:hypothetical protein
LKIVGMKSRPKPAQNSDGRCKFGFVEASSSRVFQDGDGDGRSRHADVIII